MGTAIDRGAVPGLLMAAVPALLFAPVFLQLDGHVYRGASDLAREADVISLLPIPLAAFACLLGCLWMVRSALRCPFSWLLGLSLLLMACTSVLLGGAAVSGEKLKLLVFQFGLPMAGLVLGRFLDQYSAGRPHSVELGVIAVLTMVVPFQLYETLTDAGGPLLADRFLGLGIYAHLQYVPTVLIAGYVLALFGLWRQPGVPRWASTLAIVLAPLIGVYAGASLSMLTMLGLTAGLSTFAGYQYWLRKDWRPMLLLAVAVAATGLYVRAALPQSAAFARKLSAVVGPAPSRDARPPSVSPTAIGPTVARPEALPSTAELVQLLWARDMARISGLPPNVAVRLGYWRFYTTAVLSSPSAALLGHAAAPDRRYYPSAHNYYLDLAYHFGLVPLLPIVGLIVFTAYRAGRVWPELVTHAPLVGLTCAVAFLLFADNGIRVGMRQPYSGVITFFLWGVLLTRLGILRQGGTRDPRAA